MFPHFLVLHQTSNSYKKKEKSINIAIIFYVNRYHISFIFIMSTILSENLVRQSALTTHSQHQVSTSQRNRRHYFSVTLRSGLLPRKPNYWSATNQRIAWFAIHEHSCPTQRTYIDKRYTKLNILPSHSPLKKKAGKQCFCRHIDLSGKSTSLSEAKAF